MLEKIALGLMFGLGFAAQGAESTDEIHSVDDLRDRVDHAARREIVYRGFKTGTIDDGEGTFCHKERTWSFYYEGRVGDMQPALSADGVYHLDLGFERAKVSLSGFRKGGVLCTWQGSMGDLGVKDLHVRLALEPRANPANTDEGAHIRLEGVSVQGFEVHDVNLALEIFSVQNGNAPAWLTSFLEERFNNTVAPLVLKAFQDRIDNSLSSLIARFLEKVRRDGLHGT